MGEFKKLDDMVMKPTSNPDISVHFDKKYDNYPAFYEETKEEIYRAIVQLFKKLSESTSDRKVLQVSAIIEERNFCTDFTITRTSRKVVENYGVFDKEVLQEMIPFFEEKEEYELCSEILKVYEMI